MATDRLTGHLVRLIAGIRQALTGIDGDGTAGLASLTAFAIRICSAGLAFLSQVVLARLMGQFEYGIFVFAWVFAIILGNLSCLGFPTSLIRFIPQYRESGSLPELRGLLFTSQVFVFVSAGLMAAAGILCLYLIGDRIDAYFLVPLYLGAFALPMIALGDVLDGAARANNWPVNALSPTFLVRPVLILVFAAIAVLSGFSATAIVTMAAALAATSATTLGQFFILGRRLRRRYGAGDRLVLFTRWFRVALPIFLVEGFYYLLTNSDVIMVGFFVEPDLVATYYAAAKIMALVHFVFFAVKAGASPRFSELVAARDRDRLASFIARTIRWTFWPSLAFGCIVLALGPFLLMLFGPNFTNGYPLMFVLFIGIMAKAAIGPAEALLIMSGHQGICAAIYAGAFFCNIFGNIILIPLIGITGAAIATAFAMTIEAALLFMTVRKNLDIDMIFGPVNRKPASEIS